MAAPLHTLQPALQSPALRRPRWRYVASFMAIVGDPHDKRGPDGAVKGRRAVVTEPSPSAHGGAAETASVTGKPRPRNRQKPEP